MSAVDFQPVPTRDMHENFLRAVVEILFENVVFASNQTKVVLWQPPQKLEQCFDFSLGQNGVTQEKLLVFLKNTIKFSVKTGHRYFINQLFSGLDPYGLAGQWLTDALNASVYTYEVAPVFTLMETHIIGEVCRMVGPQWGDGMFCPGGSTANGTAINLARFRYCPDIKKSGSCGLSRFVLFTSEECHYSIHKFASFIGIGEDNVILISTDSIGQIVPEDLDEKIKKELAEGAIPLAVIATLGTTVRGAFDPICEIAEICKKYNIWLHIDAAWGGGLIFSQKHRAKLNGIERADSIVINPHKLLAVPQQCSILLVKNRDILYECHSKHAEYLFQKDKYYDKSYDLGDKYLQCGRKCDVFKFWFMWKAKGSSGFANHIDTLMDLAEYFEGQIRERPEFMLVSPRQYMNVCFWYLPRYLQGKQNILDYSAQLHKVAPQIKAMMIKHGSVMMGYQPLKKLPNFFRFVSQNSSVTKKDVTYILDLISEIGTAIYK
ncbi:cysteine sulfinic acid decarboxylase [Tribolium castaneum]|uniref:cysteine sulfinic acid decarboxylase n=1 Tax=Tribolium castaneum TaxID=7070 RepID=UPI0000D5783E|nr:PREDICTED: cysteine sulfinic acid decarboxylase [Tribolium castaneum]|eukprot:XP_971834.1 PREDICTED: cysteine sulfinic acid decarboxylase [Tribolium castaneum]